MHVEVGEIHIGDTIVAAEKLLASVMALHLEVLVPNFLVGIAEISASGHLTSALLWEKEEV